jgi:enoyl-CoA hydratase/carnithine racemase
MQEHIISRREGATVVVVLNRPEKLNALTLAMWARMRDLFTGFALDDSIRCVVIRGATPEVFGAGADIQEFPALRADSGQAREYAAVSNAALKAIRNCVHPTLAMISGTCVGGGLEIASMCDMRIASTSSRFGLPVSRLGLTMNHCEMLGLLEIVGRSTTLEILYEGRIFDAAEALQKRLVNRVVAADTLQSEVDAACRRIGSGAPLVARWHKRFADQLQHSPALSPQIEAEGYACFDTEDFRTGWRAFTAKEKVEFHGR